MLVADTQIEFLSTTDHSGTDNINLTGNNYDQAVIGNNGANVLRGGGGIDQLVGFGGNDILIADSDDLVYEEVGGGYDNVFALESLVLTAGAAVEILSTTNHGGTADINLTGNEFGQVVIGNNGANVLRGGGGIDQLVGFGGNDILIADSDDLVYEEVGGGYD
ncbi:hypothetical protein RCO27_06855, partial [Sphingosinicella sp. LHD-64]|uniref:calcium-binding protein n=1 Tax=Sphingosinicella sp. LHD-64 TaxID=3072139 RepID=UPI0028102AE7|nr:hypothetical protein [Sphingosinicella sp. LHD-64]